MPSQQLVSRSSSFHDIALGTSIADTDFSFVITSVGVENTTPLSLAYSGSAFRNISMFDDSGCAMPKAVRSMNRLMTCSSSGSPQIRSMNLSANIGYSLQSAFEKRSDMSSDILKSRSSSLSFGFSLLW